MFFIILPLAFGLDYYTEVLDLSYLLEHLSDDPFFRKYMKLNKALVGLVEDYSLVSFLPLTVQVHVTTYTGTCTYQHYSFTDISERNKNELGFKPTTLCRIYAMLRQFSWLAEITRLHSCIPIRLGMAEHCIWDVPN